MTISLDSGRFVIWCNPASSHVRTSHLVFRLYRFIIWDCRAVSLKYIYIYGKITPPENCLSSAVLNWTERAFSPRGLTLSHSGHYGNLVKFVTGPRDNIKKETEFSFIQQPVIISGKGIALTAHLFQPTANVSTSWWASSLLTEYTKDKNTQLELKVSISKRVFIFQKRLEFL